MISHSEVEAIYAGVLGRSLIVHAANMSAPAASRDVVRHFIKRLRTYAGQSGREAMHYFNVQLAAVTQIMGRDGFEAGQALAEDLLLAVSAAPTGSEVARLQTGFCQALRAQMKVAGCSMKSSQVQAILPWLHGSTRFLSTADANALHRELS